MHWSADVLQRLAAREVCGYYQQAPPATEPTALTALALLGHHRLQEAAPALRWLTERQADDGSLGVTAQQSEPRWPTSLAVLAWSAAEDAAYEPAIARALHWILGTRSNTFPRPKEVGHDTTLTGWPWVAETHGWVEPTALHVLALKAAGYHRHARRREAVRMLKDRLLVDGGCNPGNTVVLGGTQRPHLLPSGLAMLALAGETDEDGRAARTLDYITRRVPRTGGTASLCYGLMALAAHDRDVPGWEDYLKTSAARTMRAGGSPLRLALLALAALHISNPLITLTQPIPTS